MEIGKRIRMIRQEKALKQEEFGALHGSNRSVISRLESGRQLIDQDLLNRLWTKLGVSPHWIITGEDIANRERLKEISELKAELASTKELLAAKTEIIQLMKKVAGAK